MSAEINLIKIDGKPLEKLIDVISKGIGKLYEPKRIRKEADAEAYKIEIVERAKAKAVNNTKELEQDFLDRIEERIIHREIKKQRNLDKVNSYAAEELKNEKEVSGEPVDEDWINRFFTFAEDISSEEMQMLWGKILAGEVKKPKSYSVRTLELIRNLTKDEANVFIKIAQLTLSCNTDKMIYKGNDDELGQKFSISFDNIALLVEIGIIQPGDFISYELRKSDQQLKSVFTNGNVIMIVEKKENTETTSIPIYLFTKIGAELLNLIPVTSDMGYLKEFAKFMKTNGLTIQYANILSREGNKFRHTKPLMEFVD